MTERTRRKKQVKNPDKPIFILDVITGLLDIFTEKATCGGSYVNGPNRLMLLGLALSMQAKDILETGYNTGLTTLALALSGARVVGVDNGFEDRGIEAIAGFRLQGFPNASLVQSDALTYLLDQDDESFDMVFVDDCHWPDYTVYECQEVRRILRPGGCAVFHDTLYAELWDVINAEFPADWQRINFPSHQPTLSFSGVETMQGLDLGLGVVRKPHPYTPHPLSRETCLADGVQPEIHIKITETDSQQQREFNGPQHKVLIEMILAVIRTGSDNLLTKEVMRDPVRAKMMREILSAYGEYCSNMASHVGRVRYHKKEANDPTSSD